MKNYNITTTRLPTTVETDDFLFITQIVCYCVISIVGSLANLVICVGLSRGRLKSSEYFILNLAVADLLVCAIGIPLDIYLQYVDSWPYGAFLCRVISPSQTLLILVSILTLMGMSLERHRAICNPLKQRLTSKWICCSIACIWVISIAAVVPYANALDYINNDCEENWSVPENAKYYTLALFIIDYCIPLTIITYCYAKAGYVLNSKFKKFNRKESTSAKQNMAVMKRLQQKKKVIKIFSTAVVLFVVCVLPGDCYWMWLSFRSDKYHPHDSHLQAFSTIMLYANSAINPFIFGAVQMICNQRLKSRFSDQLTSTTGLSRSKGSGSSVGLGEGLNRKAFSRTAVRKHVKYTSLNTKNEVTTPKNEARDLNETVQRVHKIYPDADNRLTETSKDWNDTTNREYRDPNNNGSRIKDEKKCDINMNNLCDANQIRDSIQSECDTKERERDTNKEKHDTQQPQRDANEESPCSSNEAIHDVKSISSDSCATLHRESDTFSLTSETLYNTDRKLIEQSDNTKYLSRNTDAKKEQDSFDECPSETKIFGPKKEGSESLMNKSTENELNDTENELQSAKTEEENFAKSEKCGKDNIVGLSDYESTELGRDKTENIIPEPDETKSMQETDL